MSLRVLGVLQWSGLMLGAGVWAAQHVIGSGVTQANCGAAGVGWGISNDAWQLSLAVSAALLVLLAEAAAVTVFVRTRGAGFGDGPPAEEQALRLTRLHFFAVASMAANAIFLTIILLDGIASVLDQACRQG